MIIAAFAYIVIILTAETTKFETCLETKTYAECRELQAEKWR